MYTYMCIVLLSLDTIIMLAVVDIIGTTRSDIPRAFGGRAAPASNYYTYNHVAITILNNSHT